MTTDHNFTGSAQRDGFTIERVETGLIRIVGKGVWSPEAVDAHFQELRPIVDAVRSSGSGVRMLVDLRGSGVQSAPAIERMKAGVPTVTAPGDRIAIVVQSSLAKMEMRLLIADDQHQFFISPEAALKWVEAY